MQLRKSNAVGLCLGIGAMAAISLAHVSMAAAQENTDVANDLSTAIERFQAGEYEEAQGLFGKIIAVDPDSADGQYFLGLSAAKLDNHERAIEAFRHAGDIDPELPGLYLNLGISQFELGRNDDAAVSFQRAIESDPDSATAHLFAGLNAMALEKPEEAIPSFEQAEAIDTGLAQLARYNIGLAELKLGNTNTAKSVLESAIAADPSSETATSARTLLAQIEEGATGVGEDKRLSAYFSAGIQWDDNVTTDEIDQVSSQADSVYVFDLGVDYIFYRDGNTEAEVGYSASQSFYDELTSFDLQSHTLSLSVDREEGEWDLGLSGYYARTLLGDDDFLGIANISPSIGRAVTDTLYVSGRYSLQDRNFISTDGRDATRNSVNADAFFFFLDGKGLFSAGYQLAHEDARADEFDLVQHKIDLGLRLPIPTPQDWLEQADPRLDLGYQYSLKDYTDETPSIGRERKDERTSYSVTATADITEYAYIAADFEAIDSVSNLPSNDFDEKVYTLKIGFTY